MRKRAVHQARNVSNFSFEDGPPSPEGREEEWRMGRDAEMQRLCARVHACKDALVRVCGLICLRAFSARVGRCALT